MSKMNVRSQSEVCSYIVFGRPNLIVECSFSFVKFTNGFLLSNCFQSGRLIESV
jgi:hypothetical protein